MEYEESRTREEDINKTAIVKELSVSDLVKNGKEWNYEWITTAGKDHWLASTWKILYGNSPVFSQTSCEVTAAMIRWKFGCDDWIELEKMKFKDVMDKYLLFQITIGTNDVDQEHVITIYKNHIIQSYFDRYPIRATRIDKQLIKAIDNISSLTSYLEITGGMEYYENIDELKVFYWVPV